MLRIGSKWDELFWFWLDAWVWDVMVLVLGFGVLIKYVLDLFGDLSDVSSPRFSSSIRYECNKIINPYWP